MDNTLNKISSCEVCSNKNLIDVLNLGNHPLCDSLIQIGDSTSCDEYPIDIVFCNQCKTAHQKYQVSKKVIFTETYHYRSKLTRNVTQGMMDLVNSYKKDFGSLVGLKVLDVGCNDGTLLNFFKEEGAKTFGIDPTGAAKEAAIQHKVIQAYLDDINTELLIKKFGLFDVITFTNVFAHIEDISSLIRNTKKLMQDSTTLIIENHYLGSIFKLSQFDTFYHEHPRTYSLTSLKYIAKKMKRKISKCEFPERYGGNIRVFISKHKEDTKYFDDDLDYIGLFNNLNSEMNDWIINKRKELDIYFEKYGRLPAKAFPGRAAILINLLGLTEDNISAVYEIKGSIKTGFYIPGTRIPILPEVELYKKTQQKPIINLAWHISDEVKKNLKNNNYTAEVIDIK